MTAYTIYTDANTGQATLCCGLCDAVSPNPHDIASTYCGRCHLFLDLVATLRTDHQQHRSTHDCGEWRSARGLCALCDRPVEAPAP